MTRGRKPNISYSREKLLFQISSKFGRYLNKKEVVKFLAETYSYTDRQVQKWFQVGRFPPKIIKDFNIPIVEKFEDNPKIIPKWKFWKILKFRK